jgi:hypothetical protein
MERDTCGNGNVQFPCGLPADAGADADAGNSFCPANSPDCCAMYCPGGSYNTCQLIGGPYVLDEAGSFVQSTTPQIISCSNVCLMAGRRPALLSEEAVHPAACVGDFLAHAAYLEAVSVPAFLQLSRQLQAHGAPRNLVARARRAARDEVRHARIMSRLARAHGGVVPEGRVIDPGTPSLLEIALLNATEGCVRETWGAACTLAQSHNATDPSLRRAMRGIARDELAHAALSWDIAAWIARRLTPAERREVEAARRRAIAELEDQAQSPCPEEARAVLGLPSMEQIRRILSGMRSEVWLAAA